VRHLVSLASAEAGPLAAAEAGGKAERLSLALRAGLPVLPGWVVPARCARPGLHAGAAAIRARGPAAGRRAILGTALDEDLAAELAEAARLLGGRVIVRSSSPLERDPRWSGAFSTVAEVGEDDVATAVRSVWASALAPDPLDRLAACGMTPEQVDLAALVQPEIRPDAGGTAQIDGDAVIVDGVRGHPGAMLSGWADGASASVRGARCAGNLPALIGPGAVLAAADLARATLHATGDDSIEWASAGGDVWLLQAASSGAVDDLGPAGDAQAPDLRAAAPEARRLPGRPAVAGLGTGRLLYRRPHDALPRGAGDVVLLVDRPVPALAPLLFASRADAGVAVRGVVTRGGPAGSHLAEVARSFGVPMVVGCSAAGPGHDGWLATVDGFAGEVTLRRPRAVQVGVQVREERVWLAPLTTMPNVVEPPAGIEPS
jgi:hypothetical protein